MQFLPFRRPPFYMPLKKRTDLVQQKSGRALCHRVAGRFDSAAFRAFGGGGRAVALVGIVVLVSVCIYSTAGVCGAFLVGGSFVGAM